MVVVYRVAALTIGVVRSAIALGLIDSDTVALPNLVLHDRVVPELIQRAASGASVAAAAAPLLRDPALREEQRRALVEVSRLLSAGGATRARPRRSSPPPTGAPSPSGIRDRRGDGRGRLIVRRVVVTGLGLVTPLGASLEATRSGLAAARCVVAEATLLDASPFSSRLAGEVPDHDSRAHFRFPRH